MSYRGGEPFAAPRPRSRESSVPASSDGSLPRGFATPPAPSETFAAALGQGPFDTARAPKVDDRLPDSGGVKAEYRRIGQLINEPGRGLAAR